MGRFRRAGREALDRAAPFLQRTALSSAAFGSELCSQQWNRRSTAGSAASSAASSPPSVQPFVQSCVHSVLHLAPLCWQPAILLDCLSPLWQGDFLELRVRALFQRVRLL